MDGMGYVIGFQVVMLDYRCWTVPFGSGKTLGFLKDVLHCFDVASWYIYIYTYSGVKKVHGYQSAFSSPSLEGTSARISQEIRNFCATGLFQPLMNWGIS